MRKFEGERRVKIERKEDKFERKMTNEANGVSGLSWV